MSAKNTDEQERLLRLLDNVEKGIRQEEATALADRERLRRQLFDRCDDEFEGAEQEIIQRDGSDISEDHESEHDTASEASLEDLGDLCEDIQVVGRDNVTQWSAHMNETNLCGRDCQHNIIRVERIGDLLPCPLNEAKL